jgi:hypothetical protein
VREPPPDPFQYTVLRVVPRVERGECLNAGVILFCRTRGFLRAAVALDEARLEALAPGVDVAPIQRHLDGLRRTADGDADAGPVARLSQSERFSWLAAPSSTIVQASPVHTGLCEDPEATLDHLLRTLVL